MTSYVQKKERMFREAGDANLVPRRSVGRIKDIASCTDRRAWVTNDEPRRQYILEMIKSSSKKESSFGKYIPIEVLIDILLAQKIAENEKLKQRIKELEALLDMYSKLELTDDQKRKLKGMKDALGLFGDGLDSTAGSTARSGAESTARSGVGSTPGSTATSSYLTGDDTDIEESPRYCQAGGGGLVRKKGKGKKRAGSAGSSAPGTPDSGRSREVSPDSASSRGISPDSPSSRGISPDSPSSRGISPDSPSSRGVSPDSEEVIPRGPSPDNNAGMNVSPGGTTLPSSPSQSTQNEYGPGGIPLPKTTHSRSSQSQISSSPPKATHSRSSQTQIGPDEVPISSTTDDRALKQDSKVRFDLDSTDGTTASGISSGPGKEAYAKLGCNELKNKLVQKDQEIANLQEKLAKMTSLIDDNEELANQLTLSQLQLVSAQKEKEQLAKTVASTNPNDLSSLEAEIESLREQGDLTPEQETELIKKELEALRKYCDKLTNIQEENEQLKAECERLKKELESSSPESAEADEEKRALEAKCNEYAEQIKILQSKLKTSVNDLLNSDEIRDLKRRSEIVNDVLNEREELRSQLELLPDLQRRSQVAEILEGENESLSNELSELKKYREQESSMAMKELQKHKDEIDAQGNDLQKLKSDKDKLNKALDSIQRERDDLKKQLECLETEIREQDKELDALRAKSQECDLIKLDRDRLQLRVEELQALEVEVLTLIEQIKNLSIERDMYKRQVCELDCVIADQEDEIKQLLFHIDRLSQSVERQQEKIKKALGDMQAELDQKNSMLQSSQDEIAELECSKDCMTKQECKLQQKINDLEDAINEKQKLISQMTSCPCGQLGGTGTKMKQTLDEALKENERLQDLVNQLQNACQFKHIDIMLAESKHAVDVVINEVQSYYEGKGKRSPGDRGVYFDDNLYDENRQLRKHSMEIQDIAKGRIEELTEQLKGLIRDNADLKAENDLLHSTNKGMSEQRRCHPSCKYYKP